MRNYGEYGRPVMLFEAYIGWRDYMRKAHEKGQLQEAAVAHGLEEADTRFDFPNFLFGPVRQSMYQAYQRVTPQYERYARKENTPDFRERRIRGRTGMTRIGYMGEHGEAPQLSRGERPSASLVVDTYGGVYSMTRQLIVNDESNELLNSAPDEIGDSAAEFIVETVMALIESNPTAPDGGAMWSSGRGNQDTAAMGETSLATAIARMTKQRDDTGRRIRVEVATVATGDPLVQLNALRVIRSSETGATVNDPATSAFPMGRDNVLKSLLPEDAVIYDPYLSDANDWYVFADPARVPAFAVGFLNGQDRPRVMLKTPELRNVLGGGGQDPYTFEIRTLDWLVETDFGVAPVDPRGTYRSVVA